MSWVVHNTTAFAVSGSSVFLKETAMRMRRRIAFGLVFGLAVTGWGAVARAQEARQIRPEVEKLKQSVAEKLQAAAEKLGLTQEQRDKIKEVHRSFETRRQALRDERRALHENDLKAINEILTPEQREKVQALKEDRVETQGTDEGPVAPAQDAAVRDTLEEKLRAAENIDLTREQRTKIVQQLSSSAEKYFQQRRARRALVEEEYRAIAEILTPEQREKARQYIEHRVVVAPVLQSVTDRLQAAADRIGLTPEQRKEIVDTYKNYDAKYDQLADDRRELLRSEMKAISGILTSEQRDRVRNYFQDHVVVLDVQVDPDDPRAMAMLKDSIAERLDATATRLGLTQEQRDKVKATYKDFAAKYDAQRDQREALRKEELKAMDAILTPEQREKVKNFFADRSTNP
jgi:Spy/CpxP family protein refolding chaperone